MHTCTKPWKRRFGIVVLVVLCAFSAQWLRSYFTGDDLDDIVLSGRAWTIKSKAGRLMVSSFPNERPQESPRWTTVPITKESLESLKFTLIPIQSEALSDGKGYQLTIHYWLAFVPLVLLAGYLLMTRPKPSSDQNATQSAVTPDH